MRNNIFFTHHIHIPSADLSVDAQSGFIEWVKMNLDLILKHGPAIWLVLLRWWHNMPLCPGRGAAMYLRRTVQNILDNATVWNCFCYFSWSSWEDQLWGKKKVYCSLPFGDYSSSRMGSPLIQHLWRRGSHTVNQYIEWTWKLEILSLENHPLKAPPSGPLLQWSKDLLAPSPSRNHRIKSTPLIH